MITIEGDSFTNRVVSSLLQSIKYYGNSLKYQQSIELLSSISIKDFEDSSIKIASNSEILMKLKRDISTWGEKSLGMFNTIENVRTLLYGIQTMMEVKSFVQLKNQIHLPHIIVTRQSMG